MNALSALLFLVISNIFMYLAWYTHLKFKSITFTGALLLSLFFAFVEFLFLIPANRIGFNHLKISITQLRILQECISLIIFTIIVFLLFQETPRWNTLATYIMIIGAVLFIFKF